MATIDALTIDGAKELLKRYGRDFCRRISMIFFDADVNPPDAPPSAFPNVDVTISTSLITLLYSIEPLPVLPTNPVA